MIQPLTLQRITVDSHETQSQNNPPLTILTYINNDGWAGGNIRFNLKLFLAFHGFYNHNAVKLI